MSKSTIHVLGHEQARLDRIVQHPGLMPHDLTQLTLPERYAGNDLAENRFFLAEEATEGIMDAGFVGVVTARWNERFPQMPPVEALPTVAQRLSPHSVFAPVAHPVLSAQVDAWRERQDLWHPGVASMLQSVAPVAALRERLTNVVLTNNFVVHRDVYAALVAYHRSAFAALDERFGFPFPVGFRCSLCGFSSESGIGRGTGSRASGYLMERVTAQFFMSRSDLALVDAEGVEVAVPLALRAGQYLPSVANGFLFRANTARMARPRRQESSCAHPEWQ